MSQWARIGRDYATNMAARACGTTDAPRISWLAACAMHGTSAWISSTCSWDLPKIDTKLKEHWRRSTLKPIADSE